jgi:hypothetical protein
MDQADNLYQSLIDTGKWHSESESEKRIIALTAQVQSLEKAKAKPAQHQQRKPGRPQAGRLVVNKKDGKFQRGKPGKPQKNNPKREDEPKWKTEAPGAGQRSAH